MALTLTPLRGIPLVVEGDNIARIIEAALRENGIDLADGDILVIGQKIISKAEGRLVDLASIEARADALALAGETGKDPRLLELILRESKSILRARPGTIIVEHRLGFVCANAGVDHSNVAGPATDAHEFVLLLPLDPDGSAAGIRAYLESQTGKKLGVVINDSHGRAWRLGTVGTCIGLSNVPGLVDQRGWPDLFGYNLQATIIGAVDELAAAASLVMGQAAEGTPVVHVRGFPYPLREASLQELLRPQELDLFR
jgi:coenzyme F420-0:L-glutamate ligase/coenzyme F420-1:gamma-L-glutamate ligase